MPHTYGDEDLENVDEKYHESSDEDFNPEAAPPEEASSSEDEDHVTIEPTQRKGKRKAPADEDLDSGDEVTIQAARKKRAKKKRKKGGNNDGDELIISDDEGGEGGLIKTRAQRRIEGKERRPLARTEGATVDVDALWAQMTAAPLKPLDPTASHELAAQQNHVPVPNIPVSAEEEEQLTIKKVFTFAGQDTTEEKQVPRSQLDKYFKEGWKTLDASAATIPMTDSPKDTSESSGPKIRRPLRRPSRFDPNPTGYVRALAPEHQLFWPRTAATDLQREQEIPPETNISVTKKVEKTQKLNVVDKSRMDWTGFVDKEGIAEELDTHGKTKEAYLGRMEFLAGVEARREEERRNLKIKAAAAAPTVG
ncbi:bucentaur or craniofacial development-domain-containing protein [Alternaria rosae]|uniref:bucentaur or craniofacial development-domain-containing protein n=1 Tax=Alternaria rosae TaxID=1187941 RepID=UPI001E8E0F77|nr:bucentaur or craniofacial development-domain-containing protein [Alternaria rosae]KAH6872834.1 bucentaur or craniofacial development-domain-containing protein [Alternaria rosae]